jgi:hypothetical protein
MVSKRTKKRSVTKTKPKKTEVYDFPNGYVRRLTAKEKAEHEDSTYGFFWWRAESVESKLGRVDHGQDLAGFKRWARHA